MWLRTLPPQQVIINLYCCYRKVLTNVKAVALPWQIADRQFNKQALFVMPCIEPGDTSQGSNVMCACTCTHTHTHTYTHTHTHIYTHIPGNFSPCGRRTYKSNFGLARRARPKFKKLTPGVPEKRQWPEATGRGLPALN